MLRRRNFNKLIYHPKNGYFLYPRRIIQRTNRSFNRKLQKSNRNSEFLFHISNDHIQSIEERATFSQNFILTKTKQDEKDFHQPFKQNSRIKNSLLFVK
jgi:hypothetical protein